LKVIQEDKLIALLALVEQKLETNQNTQVTSLLNIIKNKILEIEKQRNNHLSSDEDENVRLKQSFDDNNKIKVKLSYPKNDTIDLKVSSQYEPEISKVKNEYVFNFGMTGATNIKDYDLKFVFSGSTLFFNDNQVV
jgi:hypothetical protein